VQYLGFIAYTSSNLHFLKSALLQISIAKMFSNFAL